MKRKIHLLLPFVLLAIVFVACDETEEAGKYDNWRTRNDVFIDSLQNVYDAKIDPDLKMLKDETNGRSIFFKILKSGDPKATPPFYTSSAGCYYRGMYIDEAVFNANPNEKYYTRLYKQLTVFDPKMAEDNPNPDLDPLVEFTPSGSVTGFGTALMYMRPGDRWELYIPYQSGYQNSIDQYTTEIMRYGTLIFDVTMVEIDYYPTRSSN